jgi:NAD(P)-dependent dehydrogenase (short-subunit alcohol dehydrogenase family)
MNTSFENKVALVTGAGSGLGLATAKAFAQSGASVALADANGLTKSAALDYAARGIRINAVCPGIIHTAMLDKMMATQADALNAMLKDVPIGRLGRPEEIASAVLWLCSSAASFMVGHALAVDGGYTIR